MIDWTTIELGEAMELKRGYDLPKRKRIEGPFPIISSSGKTGKHEEFKVKGPGVITGRYGTIGEVFFEKGNFWPLNTALYVKNFDRVTPRFCYYFLSDFNFDKFNDKSTVPGINRNHIHQEVIKIPPTEEQEAIAEVLSSLDDKIDHLKRQNKTLEGMAEALFRQWFIEEAQDDWEEVTLLDLAEVVCGKTPSKKNSNFYGGPFPFIKIPDMHGRTFVSTSNESLSLLGSQSQLKKLLPPHSILVSLYCNCWRGEYESFSISHQSTNQRAHSSKSRIPTFPLLLLQKHLRRTTNPCWRRSCDTQLEYRKFRKD